MSARIAPLPHGIVMHRTSLFPLAPLSFLALGSLGCLLGGGPLFDPNDSEFDDFTQDERRDEIERPDYNPPHYDQRDDPSSPEFRGAFDLSLSQDLDARLDASKLGEATYTYVEDDGSGDAPHCLITLADRTPDASGAQGYLILQFFGAGCPLPGTYDLSARPDGATLKTLQIDRETDTSSTFTAYRDPKGTLTITRNERLSRLEGALDVELSTKLVDDAPPADTNLSMSGEFKAIHQEF